VVADIGASRLAHASHQDRIFNMGIREQLMVSFAGGLALEGIKPIVHSYTPFLVERPFEQLKLDLSHQGVGAVLVSVGASFDASGEGRTHQSPGDVALIQTLPDWEIHVPGHPDELAAAMRRGMSRDGSSYIRMSNEVNREPRPIGAVSVERPGANGTTILAVGPMLDPVMEGSAGYDVTVLYTPTVRPLDGPSLRRHLSGDQLILVEPYLEGTTVAAVTRAISRPIQLTAIGVPNEEHRHYGTPKEHAAAHRLDAEGLRRRFEALLPAAG
jgi:transketolase